MPEVQIKLEIQDSAGAILKRVTIAVPDSITKAQLAAGIKSHFGDIIQSDDLEIFIDLPDNRPIFGKFVVEGARVIVRPKSSASYFKVLHDD
ncbi:MAG: hypothetical protein DDG60_12580 [Anaerolineae bacterium]|nr:MAG: hypothetical protein DDG60_12580 [Anaerolineae bacterium]